MSYKKKHFCWKSFQGWFFKIFFPHKRSSVLNNLFLISAKNVFDSFLERSQANNFLWVFTSWKNLVKVSNKVILETLLFQLSHDPNIYYKTEGGFWESLFGFFNWVKTLRVTWILHDTEDWREYSARAVCGLPTRKYQKFSQSLHNDDCPNHICSIRSSQYVLNN